MAPPFQTKVRLLGIARARSLFLMWVTHPPRRRERPRCDGGTRPNAIHARFSRGSRRLTIVNSAVFMKWLWPVSLVSEERQSAVSATLTREPSTAQQRNKSFHTAEDDLLFRAPNQSRLAEDEPLIKRPATDRAALKGRPGNGPVADGIRPFHPSELSRG
jgi:hypothetical protein